MKAKQSNIYLKGLLSGDLIIINTIYKNNFPKVVGFIKKNKGAYRDAEEIFQDALFHLIVRSKVRTLEIKSSFDGYLFTICKNLWYKELNERKNRVRNERGLELKDETFKHISFILEQERWELFEEKLNELSDNCKTLLKDYFNKVSYDIIVKKFNYSSENVAFQRVFKCKKKLASLIKSDRKYKDLS